MFICLSIVLETRRFSVLSASHAHIKDDLGVLSSGLFSNSKDLDLYYLCNFVTFGARGAAM